MALRLHTGWSGCRIALAVLAVLLTTLTGYFSALARASEPDPTSIRIAIGEWPPYLSASLDGNGIAGKLITEAFAAAGVTVTYVFYPWNRSLELTRRGSIEATATWFESADRRADFHLSDPLIDSRFLLYYRDDKPIAWKTIDDLNGLKIGATTGYFYGEAFASAEKSGAITVIRASSDDTSLKNLLRGRLDAFPLDQNVAAFIFANDLSPADAARIGNNDVPVHSRPQYLLVSRRIPNGEALIRLFNRGLSTIRGNGAYQRIVSDPAFSGNNH